MIFKKLSDRTQVDLVPYIKDIVASKPDTTIFIGTDSQSTKRFTVYATVIVLYYDKKGGHVLFNKTVVPRIKDTFTRLWKEVDLSVGVAQELAKDFDVKYIDLDFNEDKKYQSNSVLLAAVGYVTALGFTARYKPLDTYASRVADVICRP